MIAEVVAALLVPATLVYLYRNAYKRSKNFPPGPPTIPFYGSYLLLRLLNWNNLTSCFTKLCRMYNTKILGAYFSGIPTVIVNDSKLIKDVLNHEDFDGRMDIILFRLRSYWKKLGIFFTDGYFWHTQRRFSLRYMRDYGFGRRSDTLENVVAGEIKELLDITVNGPKYPAEKEIVQGNQISLPHYFAVPFINGLCHVIARMTLPRSDYHVCWDLAKGALKFQLNSDDLGGFLSIAPWIKDFAPNWSGFKALTDGNQKLLDFFGRLIDDVIATHEDGYDRHFLDVYITKMNEEKLTKDKTTYSVEQLRLICVDYMFPAASATEAVLSMLVERLLLHPEIQERVHEEIDRVVGRDRLPTLDDRKDMPYTEACIREQLRFDTLVPLGVPHRTTTDVNFGGYDIPEDTLVAVNYVTLHSDKAIWKDPEQFRPERFITDGKLNLSSDKSLPFGAGRRLCAGETFARQTMFQVFAAFMQAFTVSTADGKPLTKPATRIMGIITTIPAFNVQVTPRK